MKFLVGILSLLFLYGCTLSRDDTEFALPEGSATAGKELFARFQCGTCHDFSGKGDKVRLGGDRLTQKTYNELVTSVINPSHRIAPAWLEKNPDATVSPMKVYNDIMTVAELVDLVTFIRSKYKVIEWKPMDYKEYEYRSRSWKLRNN